jgi:molybdate transport system substrate-binding protein
MPEKQMRKRQVIGKKINSMKLSSLFLALALLSSTPTMAQEPGPIIAAAANIKFALDNIIDKYQEETGIKVRVSYGASGNFLAQIQHGAPFELLLSADEFYPKALHQLGLTLGEGQVYAIGRLALVAPKLSPLSLDPELKGLASLIEQGQLSHFALANPMHAPYGQRAQEVLEQLGLWEKLEGKLILGENVSQALQFALSGSTQGGIVALSLVKTPQFSEQGRYIVLPQSLHQPLMQRMVLMKQASPASHAFYNYLLQPQSQAIFVAFGFEVPEQASVQRPVQATVKRTVAEGL